MKFNSFAPPRQLLSIASAGLIAMIAILGCQRGPAVVFVEGTVRLDGTALDGASVAFTPAESSGGAAAAGFTDAQGRFVLSARGARLGAGTTVGDYIVIVSKTVIPPGEESKASPKVELATPEAYRLKETSPLRATVKKGRNRFEFDLVSDVK